jgi:hypothetical protein
MLSHSFATRNVSWVIHGRSTNNPRPSILHVQCWTRSLILERCFVFRHTNPPLAPTIFVCRIRIKSCVLHPHSPCPSFGWATNKSILLLLLLLSSSLVPVAAITLWGASQRVFVVAIVVYFVMDSVRKLLDTPSSVCGQWWPHHRILHKTVVSKRLTSASSVSYTRLSFCENRLYRVLPHVALLSIMRGILGR